MKTIVIAATKEDVEAFNNGQITLNEMRKRAGLSQIGEPTFNKKFISKRLVTQKCPSCGGSVSENGNFCSHCGKKVKDECCYCWVRKKDNYNCGESSCPGFDLFRLEKSNFRKEPPTAATVGGEEAKIKGITIDLRSEKFGRQYTR